MSSAFQVTQGAQEADPYIKVFIYAKFGRGKTVLGATAVDVPEMKDVLFLNAEAGMKSIKASQAVKAYKDIDSIKITSFDQFIQVEKFMRAYCIAMENSDEELLEKYAKKVGFDTSRRYKTIVIDSIYELGEMHLAKVLGVNPKDLDSDTLKAGYDEWGRHKSKMNRVIRSFRDLPMHVILLAPAKEHRDENGLLNSIDPMITGSFREDIQGMVDIVGYLDEKEIDVSKPEEDEPRYKRVRRLLLQPGKKMNSKSRLTPDSVRHIDNPTMADLIGFMK